MPTSDPTTTAQPPVPVADDLPSAPARMAATLTEHPTASGASVGATASAARVASTHPAPTDRAVTAPARTVPTSARPAAPAAPGTRSAGLPGRGVVVLLGALAFLPAATTDMYLPSLPDVARELSTTSAAVQLTISGMMIGGALSQLVMGPLSDRFGRRRPALFGLVGFVVVALGCLLAADIGQLIALRVLQGVMGAAASVVAVAVIGDRCTGAEAARLMSRLWLFIAIAPLLAPLAGTWVADRWGWRAVFAVLAAVGAVLAIAIARGLPETLPPERRASRGLGAWLTGYRTVLRDRQFVALALVPALGLATIMSYVVGSPFVFRREYGLAPETFALVFGLGATGMIVGSQVNAALVRSIGPLRLLRVAVPATAAAVAVMTFSATTQTGGIAGLLVPLWCSTALLASVMSNAGALAVSRHPERAGTAAAVLGVVQSGLGGVVSPLVGVLGATALAMTGVMLTASLLAVVALAVGTSAYRRRAAR